MLGIQPGPNHAGKRVDVTFEPLVHELLELCEHGLEVKDLWFQKTYTMKVFLGFVSADTIARSSIMMVGGVRHYLADMKTMFRGMNKTASGMTNEESGTNEGEAMRFYGYAEPVFQPFMLVFGGATSYEECIVFANEEKLWLDDTTNRWLGQEVASGHAEVQTVGRHGVAPFSKLPYFDSIYGFATSVVHAAFYGVFKDFCYLLLGKSPGGQVYTTTLATADIKIISSQSEGICVPSSFKRPYKDIVAHSGRSTAFLLFAPPQSTFSLRMSVLYL